MEDRGFESLSPTGESVTSALSVVDRPKKLVCRSPEFGSRGPAVRLIWRALLKSAGLVQRSTGPRLGRLLFAPIRRGIVTRLRLLVSGGARLEPETEERLEAPGGTVLSGYGLAETASLFTGNRPGLRRSGSVGRPIADGEIRIAQPDEEGIDEIELHGSSITGGYLDNPEANREAFTPDGWYRTGDLGFVDRDGFLFVSGRVKEVLGPVSKSIVSTSFGRRRRISRPCVVGRNPTQV